MKNYVVKSKACLNDPGHATWFGTVKKELKRQKITQKQMASDLGMDYTRLSRVISGEVSDRNDSDDVSKINDYLGIRAVGRNVIDNTSVTE